MHVQLVLEMTTSLLASSGEGKSYFHLWKFRFSLGTGERRWEKSEFPFCKQTMLQSSLTVVWSRRCLYFPPAHPHGFYSFASFWKLSQVRSSRPLVYWSSSLPAREMWFPGLYASVWTNARFRGQRKNPRMRVECQVGSSVNWFVRRSI